MNNLYFFKVFIIVFIFQSIQVQAKDFDEVPEWIRWARRLTGESDLVRSKSIQKLQADKGLKAQLVEELKHPAAQNGRLRTQRFLAYDVITALQLHSLLPELKTHSASDFTGFSYHTMNTLITPTGGASLADYYKEIFSEPSASVQTRIAILDSLGRMGIKLPADSILKLSSSSSEEFRSSVLNYVREFLIVKRSSDYRRLLPFFLQDESWEIRMQAAFLLSELEKMKNEKLSALELACVDDPEPSVRDLCREIKSRLNR